MNSPIEACHPLSRAPAPQAWTRPKVRVQWRTNSHCSPHCRAGSASRKTNSRTWAVYFFSGVFAAFLKRGGLFFPSDLCRIICKFLNICVKSAGMSRNSGKMQRTFSVWTYFGAVQELITRADLKKSCKLIFGSSDDVCKKTNRLRYSRERTFQSLGNQPTPDTYLGQKNIYQSRSPEAFSLSSSETRGYLTSRISTISGLYALLKAAFFGWRNLSTKKIVRTSRISYEKMLK